MGPITQVRPNQDMRLPTFADKESIGEVRKRTKCGDQVEEFGRKRN